MALERGPGGDNDVGCRPGGGVGFRRQPAKHVLEAYRTAVAERGVLKEMLSDALVRR